MSDGSLKNVKSLQIGDKVKTLDQDGNLIDTDVIMMLDFQNHNQECIKIKFLVFYFQFLV